MYNFVLQNASTTYNSTAGRISGLEETYIKTASSLLYYILLLFTAVKVRDKVLIR